MQNNATYTISIDRRSTVPFDDQIKENIKSMILDRTMYYQTKLPTISILADQLGIPDKTVAKAYQQLDQERYIKQTEGDYYVSYIELTTHFFERNTSIYDAIIDLGLTPSITCLEKAVVTLPEDTMHLMGFDPLNGNQFLYINRMYYGDKQPIIILQNYIPLYLFPAIDQKLQGHEALNNFIQEHYGFAAHMSRRVTKVVNLKKELAELLNERVNAASLQSTNQVYDAFHRLIDYGQSHSVSGYYFQAMTQKELHE